MKDNLKTMIEVKDATVRFNIASERIDNLKEYFIKLVKKELMFKEFLALKNINFNKTFFSCNAIKENDVMTSTFEESYTQEIVLNNSDEKYLLVDDSKFEKVDFINFYTLDKLTGIVINNTEKETLTKIEKYVNLII